MEPWFIYRKMPEITAAAMVANAKTIRPAITNREVLCFCRTGGQGLGKVNFMSLILSGICLILPFLKVLVLLS